MPKLTKKQKATEYLPVAKRAVEALRGTARLMRASGRPNYKQVAADVRELNAAHELVAFDFPNVSPNMPSAVAMLISSGHLLSPRYDDFADSVEAWIAEIVAPAKRRARSTMHPFPLRGTVYALDASRMDEFKDQILLVLTDYQTTQSEGCGDAHGFARNEGVRHEVAKRVIANLKACAKKEARR